jgi:hypothetical protein
VIDEAAQLAPSCVVAQLSPEAQRFGPDGRGLPRLRQLVE